MTTDDKLRELGKELPWNRPDTARREAIRSRVLLAADDLAPARPRGRLAIAGAAFAGGVLAAAAIAVLYLARRSDPPGQSPLAHAQVSTSSAAELEHTVVATPGGVDEAIRVHAGSVRVVAPATPVTDRIRVVTADADVEGAGDYEVVVARDALTSVAVRSGAAHVTLRGQPRPVYLAAGETWHAATVIAELALAARPDAASESPAAPPGSAAGAAAAPQARTASEPAAARQASVARAPTAPQASTAGAPAGPAPRRPPAIPELPALAPSAGTVPDAAPPPNGRLALVGAAPPTTQSNPGQRSATERHFQAGWALLRANKLREAALELAAAADAGGADPLAADARYFQAVALVKADQRAEAERALVAFLDHAPRSLRRGRAAVMLGRLIAGRGDAGAARAWFEAAIGDPDRDVAAAARAGLDGIARGKRGE